ncbi:MAG: BON domain-containing protein [Candidatus Binatia bacterium]|nr:BON domain-containing protein [Candidatus Binatia bacterium]
MVVTMLLTAGVSPAIGFLPYRRMLQAARNPEQPLAFVHDKMLRTSLRRALVEADPVTALSISPYVFGGHAYLVGWVKNGEERSALENAARGVSGLASFSSYLPTEPSDAPISTDELALEAKAEAAITVDSQAHRMNVSVDVLGTHAVLVGIVPEPGSEKLLQGLRP